MKTYYVSQIAYFLSAPLPQVAPDVDLLQLARDLPGLVGADLANIVNEAAMTAARQGRKALSARDIYAGVDRFTQGEVRPPLPTSTKLPVLCFAAKEVRGRMVGDRKGWGVGRVVQEAPLDCWWPLGC